MRELTSFRSSELPSRVVVDGREEAGREGGKGELGSFGSLAQSGRVNQVGPQASAGEEKSEVNRYHMSTSSSGVLNKLRPD